jgi:DNA-binding NarL/FixJ family response regulator
MKVLLIDDHPMMLEALAAVIQAMRPEAEVLKAQGAGDAQRLLEAHPAVDLTLLDLMLGDGDGFEVLGTLREAHPTVPVVVVSASENAGDIVRALDLGAMGFVPKRASHQTLVEALRKVLSGGIFIPDTLYGANRGAPTPGSSTVQEPIHLDRWSLTPRQRDVLGCLLRGLPNKLIARELDLSVETVKDHVASVLRSLNVTSRTQAVLAVSQIAVNAGGVSWQRRGHV